jgi:hypothetical protein
MNKKLELYITLPLAAHLFLKGNSEIAFAMKSNDLQRMKNADLPVIICQTIREAHYNINCKNHITNKILESRCVWFAFQNFYFYYFNVYIIKVLKRI